MMKNLDIFFMKMALKQAKNAQKINEVPVGAVLVKGEKLIATGFNQKEKLNKASAHAEFMAIEMASKKLKSWRLSDCSLYVSLEPCLMCAGLIFSSRIGNLIYGCKDPKEGSMDSLIKLSKENRLNHRVQVLSGILSDESSLLIRQFFRTKKSKKKTKL